MIQTIAALAFVALSGQVTESEQLMMTTGTVEHLDPARRTMTVKTEEGEEVGVRVPDGIAAFDRVRKGDRVDVVHTESVAVSLVPPGAAPPAGREVSVTAEISSIDHHTGVVELRLPDGRIQTVAVKSPALMEQFAAVRPGESVRVTYTQATAASVEPAAPKSER